VFFESLRHQLLELITWTDKSINTLNYILMICAGFPNNIRNDYRSDLMGGTYFWIHLLIDLDKKIKTLIHEKVEGLSIAGHLKISFLHIHRTTSVLSNAIKQLSSVYGLSTQ